METILTFQITQGRASIFVQTDGQEPS